MHSEELTIEHTAQGESIEALTEPVIGLLVVFVQTLAPKIEEAGHLSALMVTSENAHRFWKVGLYFVSLPMDYHIYRLP